MHFAGRKFSYFIKVIMNELKMIQFTDPHTSSGLIESPYTSLNYHFQRCSSVRSSEMCNVYRDHFVYAPSQWETSLYPPNNEVVGGYIGFTPSVCPSVRPSIRLSRLPCPLCNIYSSGWILSILATNDHYHERVCRTQWPLTLTYIFKVIRPWFRKSCPLCSVYKSGWIIFIFGTNDHYH